uniref:Uncharacterized protein n=1 Tax=Timema poppense TaxID=170557 RepID=A0A7R9D5H1_TIMPO|nr:unnamed protein product [Timema poppensis]
MVGPVLTTSNYCYGDCVGCSGQLTVVLSSRKQTIQNSSVMGGVASFEDMNSYGNIVRFRQDVGNGSYSEENNDRRADSFQAR